jgi:plastocyanin
MRTIRINIQHLPLIQVLSVSTSFIMKRLQFAVLPAFLALAVASGSVLAAEPEVLLSIQKHQFSPMEVKVPAGQRVKLIVHNQDATPEEFESHELNREKVIPAGARVTIYVGPLKPGRYAFYGEYHKASAKGVVVVE